MEYVEKFDRKTTQEFLRAYKEKMDELFEETGVYMKNGNVKFTQSTISFSVSGNVVEAENHESAKREADKVYWDQYCYKYGLQPKHFGMEVVINSKKFTISGMKARKGKYGILGENISDGKVYGLPVRSVVSQLKNKL